MHKCKYIILLKFHFNRYHQILSESFSFTPNISAQSRYIIEHVIINLSCRKMVARSVYSVVFIQSTIDSFTTHSVSSLSRDENPRARGRAVRASIVLHFRLEERYIGEDCDIVK